MQRTINCTDGLVFRPSVPGDAAAIHLVWTRSVKATHNFLSLKYFEQLSQTLRNDRAVNTTFTLAVCKRLILGFMGMTGKHIDCLFLDPLVFRQGIGSKFVALARDSGRPLETEVHEQNPIALAFYASLGFEVVSRSALDAAGQPYPVLYLREEVQR